MLCEDTQPLAWPLGRYVTRTLESAFHLIIFLKMQVSTGIQDGSISPKIEPLKISMIIVALTEGAMLLARIRADYLSSLNTILEQLHP